MTLSDVMPERRLPAWQRYVMPVVVVAAVFGLKWLLRRHFGSQPVFPLFYAAVLISAWFGGFRSGLIAGTLSTAVGLSVLADRTAEASVWGEALRGSIFFFECALISWVVEALHAANRRLHKSAHDLLTERYRLVDTAHEGILTVSPQGHVEYANRRLMSMLGFDEHALLGKSLADFAVEQDRPQLARALAAAPTGQAETWDVRFLRPDNTHISARLLTSPILREGRLMGTLVMMTDVSARLATDQALQRTTEELRMVTEALPQIVWTTTPQGITEYYNQRWFAITGLSEEASYSSTGWLTALHPDDAANRLEQWQQSLATGQPFEVEYRLRLASDGSYRWFLGRGVPIRDGRGQIIKWVGTCTDINDHKAIAGNGHRAAGQQSAPLRN